jgi:HK97 family phage major capsid protein
MSQKLIELQGKLAERQDLLARAFAEAGDDMDFSKVKALGDGLTEAAKVEMARAMGVEMEALQMETQKENLRDIAERTKRLQIDRGTPVLPVEPIHGGGNGDGRDRRPQKSLGQRFIDSEPYKGWKKDHPDTFSVSFDDVDAASHIGLKTLMETTAGWTPESTRTGRLVDAVTRPIQALDLIPAFPIGQNSVVYMEETTRTHASAEKAEGVAYAESTFELTERTSSVRKITDSLPVTDEQLEDELQVAAYIDQRLRFGVRQRLDTQVIAGDGNAPNLRGILNTSNVQSQAKSTDPTFDAIHKAITKVRFTGRAFPNAVLLHPNDWEAIRLTRTADGLYILGNPSEAGPMTLFGLPVALGDVETENTGLVGDFANFCALYTRRGIDVQSGFVNDDFSKGRRTLRADMRAAFVVFRPAAFCKVTGI